MPDNGFRKSPRKRFSFLTSQLGKRARFTGKLAHSIQEESRDSTIRQDLVLRAQEKIAMGIYDHPSILEQAFDRMRESLETR